MRVMAADSRVSPVSALNANPSTAMRFKGIMRRTVQRTQRAYLPRDGLEERVYHLLREPAFLVLVHLDHLTPVSSNLGEMQTLAQVHQVQDVLLEARATEADRGLQEFGANPRVLSNRIGDFIDVGTGRFAYCR